MPIDKFRSSSHCMYLYGNFKIHQCLTVFLYVLFATLYSTTMFALFMSHRRNRPEIFHFSFVLYSFLPRFSSPRFESNYQMLLDNLNIDGSQS